MNLATSSVVVSLSHSIFILCESRHSSQAQNIFIAVVTICSMIDKSSYWHSASLCKQFIKHWWSSILLWQKADNILLVWHNHLPTEQSFYGNSRNFCLWQYSKSMQSIEDLLWWRQKTFFTCVTVPLTVWMILLWNAIISHQWATVNLLIWNDVKLTQWTHRQWIFCWMDLWWCKTSWFLWW